MSLSVELALSHCGARARCLTSSWSEKAELRRVIHEHAVQLRDLCAVSGAKRRSCTNTERTHRASLEHTRKPDVGAAGGLCAGNRCAGNRCAAQTHDNPHYNRLLRFVGLCSDATSGPQTARAARDPRHRLRSHHPRAHAASASSGGYVVALSLPVLYILSTPDARQAREQRAEA
jgi:hypothetical protein